MLTEIVVVEEDLTEIVMVEEGLTEIGLLITYERYVHLCKYATDNLCHVLNLPQ